MELVAIYGRTEASLDEGMDLAAPRVSFQRGLREQKLTVKGHLEPAATTWQQD